MPCGFFFELTRHIARFRLASPIYRRGEPGNFLNFFYMLFERFESLAVSSGFRHFFGYLFLLFSFLSPSLPQRVISSRYMQGVVLAPRFRGLDDVGFIHPQKQGRNK